MIAKYIYSGAAFLTLAIFTIISLLLPINRTFSQTPDWSTTVATIIYDHCSHCHHPGAIAPFSLMSYEDATSWGYSIQAQVNAKLMPPWPPDPNYNHLKDENVLSEDELNTINSWVDNGMPLGNIYLAPAAPVFNGASLMLDPDETISLPVFTVPEVGDVYWRFATHSGYTDSKFLNSIEFVAGNPSIVHHLQFSQDSSGLSWEDDLNYPGPGYSKESATSPFLSPFMAQSEGRIFSLPENIGFEIFAGSDYVTDIHYYTDSVNAIDSSRINLKFCAVENVRPVQTDRLLNYPWLDIPANTVKTFHLISTAFSEDKSLLGLGPHSHLICKSWEVYMIIPSGDTIPLISIPNWDFDWQGGYLLTKVIKIPEGSQLFGTVVFDNTINNPNNPNNPPQDVHFGEGRLDEMAQVRFWLMDYQPGDENIILDSAFYGFPTNGFTVELENVLSIYPNPASQNITVEYRRSDAQKISLTIYNFLGETIFTTIVEPVEGSFQLACSAFSPGLYLMEARKGSHRSTAKLIIER
jgi:hypothetical protein